eukprot:7252384-Pyramimonas_sp.AAC.1
MPPKDVRKLLRLGVQRWQGRRILEHHAEHLEGGECERCILPLVARQSPSRMHRSRELFVACGLVAS